MTSESVSQGREPGVRELIALSGRAYRLAAHVLGSSQAAEDVVQQAYLEAVSRLRSGPPPADARPWFLKIVAYAARDHLRREARRRRREEKVRLAKPVAAPAAGGAAETAAALRAALAALEARYRLPLALCYQEEMTQREAAAVLDLPERTVSKYVRVGLERLRRTLARAGYPAAVAAVLGGLKATAPSVPASLAGRVEALVAKGPAARPAGAARRLAARRGAAKGGSTMKVIAGVLIAGGVAASVAMMGGSRGPEPLASPPSGPPKKEHYAIAVGKNYLDGPRLEAMCMGRLLAFDSEGNGFILNGGALGAIRVIRSDNGMVETVAGDNRWNTDLNLAEGPAAFLPEMTTHRRAMAQGFSFINVSGSPLKGEEKGCVYAGVQGYPHRIYRNQEKGGRWWFKRLGAVGGALLPAVTGKTVPIKDCDLARVEVGGRFMICKGNYYTFDEAKGEATCLLSFADYESKIIYPGSNPRLKGRLGPPEQIVRAGDGSFYLRYYNRVYPEGFIFKISPDRTKVEVTAWSRHGATNFDGPALDAGYFGGPYIGGVIGDCLLVRVIDGNCVRRIKDGRTSKLFLKDGEWRETKGWAEGGLGFKNWIPGPDGRSVYAPQPGEESGGDIRIFKVSPVDFTKPTVGPKMEGGKR